MSKIKKIFLFLSAYNNVLNNSKLCTFYFKRNKLLINEYESDLSVTVRFLHYNPEGHGFWYGNNIYACMGKAGYNNPSKSPNCGTSWIKLPFIPAWLYCTYSFCRTLFIYLLLLLLWLLWLSINDICFLFKISFLTSIK